MSPEKRKPGRPVEHKAPRKRLTLELPDDVVQELDSEADMAGMNRREALEDAARQWIQYRKTIRTGG